MLDVLIASPGDATPGRDAVEQALHAWNDHRSDDTGFVLRPRRWEIASVPVSGRGDAQSVINSQLVDESDIVIGLFYNRLGTPTSRAASGTAEEIARSVASGKHVHLYFADMHRPSNVDTAQLEAMREFRRLVQNQGLVAEFKTEADLEQYVQRAVERDVKLNRQSLPRPVSPPKLLGLVYAPKTTSRVFPTMRENFGAIHVTNQSDPESDGRAFCDLQLTVYFPNGEQPLKTDVWDRGLAGVDSTMYPDQPGTYSIASHSIGHLDAIEPFELADLPQLLTSGVFAVVVASYREDDNWQRLEAFKLPVKYFPGFWVHE